MSTVISISTRRRYGVARVCRAWGVARGGGFIDAALVEAIRQVLVDSPFHGEGYRKLWARLRHAGRRTSKERVRRLMRENGWRRRPRTGRPR